MEQSPRKIRVKLQGETQDVSFEQPVSAVEFDNIRPLQSKNVLSFLLFIAVITIFYFANKNTELRSEINRIEHSRDYIYRTLESEGISWDKSSKKFIQAGVKDVNNLSTSP